MVNNKFIILIMLFVVLIVYFASAGSLIEADGFVMYVNDYGDIAKNVWVWIDTNRDSIAECYRFDSEGHLAINYKDRYGKETNDKGQFIENGEVIKKMLSNGMILNSKNTPDNRIDENVGNVINTKNNIVVKTDKWTKQTNKYIEYETNGIDETIDSKVLQKTNKDKTDIEVDILNGKTAESGIIYSNGKITELSDEVKEDKKIVAGKDFRRYISSKHKCTDKINEVYIYNNEQWQDVLMLNGDGAYVKFLIDNNNYIRFEVAEENHQEEDFDTDIILEMFVDDELIDSIDEFANGRAVIIEEYLDDKVKTIELRLKIRSGAKTRKVYIRNGRLKKIKNDD